MFFIFISFMGLLKYRFNVLPLLMSLEVFILSVVYYIFCAGSTIVFFVLTFVVVSSLIGLMLMLSHVTSYGSDLCLSVFYA